ncbi:MAG: hypothetical protein M0Q94_12770 [Candidatus Cloacimonetes bacterium]|nr:hypothetical protein [Candidatus Cloacimonadota bacterium]
MKSDLKEKLKFSARILATKPESGYEGVVYTQDAIIEFKNNQRAYVSDFFMFCTADMVGTTREIILSMLVRSLAKMDTNAVGMSPDPSRPSIDVKGCIDEIIVPDDPKMAERQHAAIVDFGIGKVLIDIDKKYFNLQLKAGDCVRVDGRVDLVSIE